MKICGYKCAVCGLILSAWGIIQLALMGVFFSTRALALIEDVHLTGDEKEFKTPEEFYLSVTKGYDQVAMNCWIAACIYVFTLLFSAYQFYVNLSTT